MRQREYLNKYSAKQDSIIEIKYPALHYTWELCTWLPKSDIGGPFDNILIIYSGRLNRVLRCGAIGSS